MYKPQRLHPLSIVDYLLRHVYSLLQALLPLLIIAMSQAGSRRWLLLAIPIVMGIFVVYGVLYWLRYVYYLHDQELRLEYGVLVRKQRYIPFERIQTVQISSGVWQRLLGLVKVQVETAGGDSKAEFVLAVLERAKAEQLQEILQAGRNIIVPEDTAAEAQSYSLSLRSLLLLASTSNGIGVALSALLVVVSQLDDLLAGLQLWVKLLAYAEGLAAGNVGLMLAALVVLLLLAWLMSLLGTLIRFAGFKLIRDGDNIKISRGLLEKQQLTLPIKRIQAIQVVEGILRQPFGMVSVQVVSISSSAGAKGEGNVLFPLLPRARVEQFLQEVLPEMAVPIVVQPLPQRARNRYLLVNVLPALIMAAAASFWLLWGYLAFIIVLPAVWLGNAQYHDAGWQIEADKTVIKMRRLGRITSIVPRRRIQSLDVSQHYFQQRRDLSTLNLAVASGASAVMVRLVGMEAAHSQALQEWLSS